MVHQPITRSLHTNREGGKAAMMFIAGLQKHSNAVRYEQRLKRIT